MFKKNIVSLGALLVCATVLGATPATAATRGAESEGIVTLTGGNTDPTEPDPTENLEQPKDGVETGNPGPLSIDWVPNFNFGEITLGSTAVVTATDVSTNPLVQVTDKRGSGLGWKLSLAVSAFKTADTTPVVLKGAKVTIGTMKAAEAVGVNTSAAPETKTASFNTSEPGAKPILVAATDTGLGTWKGKFKDNTDTNSVSLELAPDNKAGAYTSKLTWTLVTGP